MPSLETLVVATGPRPSAAVIWLHGLGADKHDFEPAVPLLDPGPDRPLRFVFPDAPVRPVTLNGGLPMRAWYDLRQLGGGDEDAPGIQASAAAVAELLDEQQALGLAPDRILLAGFSQGGALALHLGLRQPVPLAGIVALSCYLPLADQLAGELTPAGQATPIFMAHGTADPVVPEAAGRASCERLQAAGCRVAWHSYPMPHAVIPEELADLRAFLRECLPVN